MSTSIAPEPEPQSPVMVRLPRASDLPDPAAEEARNPIFGLFVREEGDVTGMLAYALYKQTKRDWLIAFQAENGRDPTDAETAAFVLGERLPRRVEAYRLSAKDMLEPAIRGKAKPELAPERPANDASQPVVPAKPAALPAEAAPTAVDAIRRISWRQLGLLLLLVVAMAGVFRILGAWLFRP